MYVIYQDIYNLFYWFLQKEQLWLINFSLNILSKNLIDFILIIFANQGVRTTGKSICVNIIQLGHTCLISLFNL